jgi:hypothetical protein
VVCAGLAIVSRSNARTVLILDIDHRAGIYHRT